KEARLRSLGPRPALAPLSRVLLDFQDFRRGDRDLLHASMINSVPPFLKVWTGTTRTWPAVLVALEAALGHPAWLRRYAWRDRHRGRPDPGRLPGIGDAIAVAGMPVNETALVAGWGLPEASGRWTVRGEATAAWRVPQDAIDLDLLIDGYVLLAEVAPSRNVEIWVD